MAALAGSQRTVADMTGFVGFVGFVIGVQVGVIMSWLIVRPR